VKAVTGSILLEVLGRMPSLEVFGEDFAVLEPYKPEEVPGL
jgi:hypothetical protein